MGCCCLSLDFGEKKIGRGWGVGGEGGGWWVREGVVGKGGGWSSVIFVTVLALRCTLEVLFIINIIYEKQHSEYCSTRFHYFVLRYKAPLDGTDGSG